LSVPSWLSTSPSSIEKKVLCHLLVQQDNKPRIKWRQKHHRPRYSKGRLPLINNSWISKKDNCWSIRWMKHLSFNSVNSSVSEVAQNGQTLSAANDNDVLASYIVGFNVMDLNSLVTVDVLWRLSGNPLLSSVTRTDNSSWRDWGHQGFDNNIITFCGT
jgi:hypothetical protein